MLNKLKNKMEYKEVPENKGNPEYTQKAFEIAKERNLEIAKMFGMEPKNPTVVYYHSSGSISSKLQSMEKEFKGYIDHTEELMLVHPDAVDGLFTDLWDEMKLITDYVLIKYYLCQKYYPEPKDFKMYYKYLSDSLAAVISDKYQDSVARFELKNYVKGKKIKKDILIGLVLNFMKQYSGKEFIFKNLDTIMEDKDIEKSLEKIYNKTPDDIFMPEKERIVEEDRKKLELEKEKRRAQIREKQQQSQQNSSTINNFNPNKKLVTRDKYKPKQAHNNNQKRQENNNNTQNNRNHSNNYKQSNRNNNFNSNNYRQNNINNKTQRNFNSNNYKQNNRNSNFNSKNTTNNNNYKNNNQKNSNYKNGFSNNKPNNFRNKNIPNKENNKTYNSKNEYFNSNRSFKNINKK